MMNLRLTYGQLPTQDQFHQAWMAEIGRKDWPTDVFRFGQDKRVGDCAMTESELWDEVQKASKEYERALQSDGDFDPEELGQWLSGVLHCLGIEWI